MAFGSTPTDSNNIPIGCVYVPNVGFNALQGGLQYTDGSSNVSTSVAVSEAGGWKQTFTVNYWGLVPVTAATDIFTISGSATKTIRIVRVEFSLISTAVMVDLQFIKRSSADTAGTTVTTNLTTSPHDSNNAAATAAFAAYTANPTLGAIVGALCTTKYLAQAATVVPTVFVKEFGTRPSQQPVLRGTAQQFCINLGGAALASQSADIAIEFTEE